MSNMLERMQVIEQRLGDLEQTVKTNDEKRHFGEGELRGYNQALERRVSSDHAAIDGLWVAITDLQFALPKPIPVVEPIVSTLAIHDGLDDLDRCSCDEAVALRAEVERLRARRHAEQRALSAGTEWLSRWNVNGPDVDSVHRALYDALTELVSVT
jgi:hypothetical protein